MTRPTLQAVLAVLLGFSAVPPGLRAQPATAVAIEARLVATDYQAAFTSRLAAVEKAMAERMAAYLVRRVGFLRFAVGDTTPYRLVFELERRDLQSNTGFEEIGFWVRLEGTPNPPLPRYWLPIREDALAGTGTEAEFLTTVSTRLSRQDAAWIRDSLLSAVPIADQALPNRNPIGWALRLRHADLCLQNNSVLEFVNEIPAGAMTTTQRFPAEVVAAFQVSPPPTDSVALFLDGVFSHLVNPADSARLDQAIRQGRVKVVGVFVKFYQHDINACRDRAGPGDGGAP